jgi:hypothetical protein
MCVLVCVRPGAVFLCGTERMSAADLTFAALAYPLVYPPECHRVVRLSLCPLQLKQDDTWFPMPHVPPLAPTRAPLSDPGPFSCMCV